jgi:hypothetical protein
MRRRLTNFVFYHIQDIRAYLPEWLVWVDSVEEVGDEAVDPLAPKRLD